MNDSFLNSANAPYVAELYFKYTQNPKGVDDDTSDKDPLPGHTIKSAILNLH